jgi:hypothetical protein
MPRFHFEIVDEYPIGDPHGTELPTEHQAKELVREMAKQIAIDVKDRSLAVIVTTDLGEEIYKTPIERD